MLARTIFRTIIALSLVLVAFTPLAGAAPKATKPVKECPHAFSEFDEIKNDVAKAPTCSAALELFSLCGVGAGSDVALGGTVTERCESDFLAKLSKAQKRAYDADHARCERKYIRQEGSMYRSFEAFCHAEVALKYVRRYGAAAARR